MKKTILWLVNSWRRVMDVRYNPLRFIADLAYKLTLQLYFLQCGVFTFDFLQLTTLVG